MVAASQAIECPLSMLYENQGISWGIDNYNALNVIDLNRVDPFAVRQAGVKIRRRDLN
jgi:hypothetical protein